MPKYKYCLGDDSGLHIFGGYRFTLCGQMAKDRAIDFVLSSEKVCADCLLKALNELFDLSKMNSQNEKSTDG